MQDKQNKGGGGAIVRRKSKPYALTAPTTNLTTHGRRLPTRTTPAPLPPPPRPPCEAENYFDDVTGRRPGIPPPTSHLDLSALEHGVSKIAGRVVDGDEEPLHVVLLDLAGGVQVAQLEGNCGGGGVCKKLNKVVAKSTGMLLGTRVCMGTTNTMAGEDTHAARNYFTREPTTTIAWWRHEPTGFL